MPHNTNASQSQYTEVNTIEVTGAMMWMMLSMTALFILWGTDRCRKIELGLKWILSLAFLLSPYYIVQGMFIISYLLNSTCVGFIQRVTAAL